MPTLMCFSVRGSTEQCAFCMQRAVELCAIQKGATLTYSGERQNVNLKSAVSVYIL